MEEVVRNEVRLLSALSDLKLSVKKPNTRKEIMKKDVRLERWEELKMIERK